MNLHTCRTETSALKQWFVSPGNMPNVLSALSKTPEFPISYIPALSSCCFLHTARRRLSIVSESFTQLNREEHTLILTGQQGKVTLHTSPTLVFRLRNEASNSSLLQIWDVLARRHQSLPSGALLLSFATPGTWSQGSRAHTCCTPFTITSACTLHKPFGFCLSHSTHATLHTSLHRLHTQAVCSFFPSRKAFSALCSSTNRNQSYGCD